jgi:hypothetical protein
MKSHSIGPFTTESEYYQFCVRHNIDVELKEFENYGEYWYAEMTDEETTVFRLTFPHLKTHFYKL